MRTTKRLVGIIVLLVSALVSVPALAARDSSYALNFGPRWHSDHSGFLDLPYDKGDVSYEIAWEGREEEGYWQLGVDYSPDVSGGMKTTDYMLTPYLNLLWSDGIFVGGLGGRQSYISDSVTGSDWSDFFWQFVVGIRLPLGSMALSAQTYYTFEKWDQLGDFDGDDLDYGVSLSYAF